MPLIECRKFSKHTNINDKLERNQKNFEQYTKLHTFKKTIKAWIEKFELEKPYRKIDFVHAAFYVFQLHLNLVLILSINNKDVFHFFSLNN